MDITQYLNDKEVIAEYPSQVLVDGDMDELLEAIGNAAKAKTYFSILCYNH